MNGFNALAAKLKRKEATLQLALSHLKNSSRCNLQNAQYNVELSSDKLRNLGRINVFIASDIDYWTVFSRKIQNPCLRPFIRVSR